MNKEKFGLQHDRTLFHQPKEYTEWYLVLGTDEVPQLSLPYM